MDSFKLIVKKSDILLLDSIIKKNKAEVITVNNKEYCILTEKNKNETRCYIWPRAWGYSGKIDGYATIYTNVDDIENKLEQFKETTIIKLQESPIENFIIEIDETK